MEGLLVRFGPPILSLICLHLHLQLFIKMGLIKTVTLTNLDVFVYCIDFSGHRAPVMMDPNIKAQHSYGEVEVSQLSDLPLM